MKKLLLIAAIAATLSACGGSSYSESSPPPAPTPTPTPPPMSMVDAFFAAVQALVASAPEDTEPVSIDAVAVTAPENTEPVQ
ncbi:hypothetical protein [Massilia soli]|uniref:Lipoprotein n=1 Tax=Massilia soli TaxID=2792854 RepID=A0ABS7SKM3_9BURK|nr:hypothetical protein [Massilia soli]MBZ2206740.1 hypothetical protein [Massilia soli]